MRNYDKMKRVVRKEEMVLCYARRIKNIHLMKEELTVNEIIRNIEAAQLKAEVPVFHVGDTVRVHAKIKEGTRERIQVFEGTEGLTLKGVHTRPTGHPMELGVSEEMLGRTFNGIGVPIDGLGEILPEKNWMSTASP